MATEPVTAWERFLEVVPAILWTVDRQGRLTILSDEAAAWLGVPRHFETALAHLDIIHPDERASFEAETERVSREGRLLDTECRTRIADGSYRWTRVRARRDPVTGVWYGATEDIHDRREAEQSLRIANERLAMAMEGGDTWAWDLDVRTGRFWYSNRWQAALGYGPDEISMDASDLDRFVHPEDRERVSRTLRAHLAGHTESYESEYRVRRKDGEWAHVVDRGRVVERGADGQPLRAIGTRADVTKLRAAEAVLHTSESQLRGIFESNVLGMSIFDYRTGKTIVTNDHGLALTGATREEIEAGTWHYNAITPEEYRSLDENAIREAHENGYFRPYEKAYVRPDGSRVDIRLSSAPLPNHPGQLIICVEDISERKQAERALAASEERLRLATEGAGMGAWDYDLKTETGIWSGSAHLLLGFEPSRRYWRMEEWQSRVHPDDIDRVLRNAADVRAHGGNYDIQFRIIRANDGRVRWMQSFGTYLYDDRGETIRHVGIFFDITERKEAEESRREGEERLKAVLESLEEGVVAFAPATGSGFANGAFRRMFAPLDPEKPIFATIEEAMLAYDLVDADGRILPFDERPMIRVMRGERIDRLPVRARFPDGREIDVVYQGMPILAEDGSVKLAVLAVRDVTKQVKAQADLVTLQQELIHVSRVSAMGAMAGSLAHELNQPLAAIANYAAAARMILASALTPVEPAREALRHVADEAVRAGQIVHRLRRFITKGEVERRPESLASIVREAIAIARTDASARSTQVKLRLDSQADTVVADRIQLQQVVFNLVRNAIEAMIDSKTRELTISSRLAGDRIELIVADRGPGLPEEVAAHLFEPFVTTKNNGMGIGLPICQSIVQAHGGGIRAEKRPGGGTIFIVSLPTEDTDE